jgi:hypothetical protein
MHAERFNSPRPQTLVYLPHPREGIIRSKEAIASDFLIKQGRVSVDMVPGKDGVLEPFISIKPEMDQNTLNILNSNALSALEKGRLDVALKFTQSTARNLPKIRIDTDGQIQFYIAKILAGGLDKHGFWMNKKELGSYKNILAAQVIHTSSLSEEGKKREGRKLRIPSSQQKTEASGLEVVNFILPSFSVVSKDLRVIRRLIRDWLNSDMDQDELRKIVNIELEIRRMELFGSYGEEDGGANTMRDSRNDDDDSGMRV